MDETGRAPPSPDAELHQGRDGVFARQVDARHGEGAFAPASSLALDGLLGGHQTPLVHLDVEGEGVDVAVAPLALDIKVDKKGLTVCRRNYPLLGQTRPHHDSRHDHFY